VITPLATFRLFTIRISVPIPLLQVVVVALLMLVYWNVSEASPPAIVEINGMSVS
jgi:hypothetical protein